MDLLYTKHGKWQRTKVVFSNVSFTAHIVLSRHPEYYICTNRPKYSDNFAYLYST